jgi:hypothetical protein
LKKKKNQRDVARSRWRTTKEEEGRSKGDAVKKGEEVERVELWGRAHEGKALLCSYSVLGRLGDVTTTLDFPGGQAPSDAEIYGG